MTTAPDTTRNHGIDILKFFAVLLITHSHMDMLYPASLARMATGGAIGDALFFFCSGFTLFLGSKSTNLGFANWYKRRIQRIYPTIFAWAIISAFAFGNHADMKHIVIWGGGWFVTCIMIYYLFFYFIRTYLQEKLTWVFLLSGAIIAIWFFADPQVQHQLFGFSYFKWAYFFFFMLLGAAVGRRQSVQTPKIAMNALLLVIGVILFYGILHVSSTPGPWAKLQLLTIVPLTMISVGGYRLCSSSPIVGLYTRYRMVYRVVFIISALCLEIYIVQYSIFTERFNHLFPANLLLNFILIFAVAFCTKVISEFFIQTFKDTPYNWKKLFVW